MTKDFRLAGVIGHPVSHSLSPLLHGGWLADLKIKGAYVPLDVQAEDLAEAVAGLKALGFAGANVTIPHKEAVATLVDHLDPVARAIGAVNTLVVHGKEIEGRNTDAHGFLAHLEASVPDWKARLGRRAALILGAGGAARAVVYALASAGVPHLIIANRNIQRSEALAATVEGSSALVLPWGGRSDEIDEAGLIVNTTSLGMAGHGHLQLDLSAAKDAIVYDLVYNPLHTELLKAAAAKGLLCVDGLGMLIHQARAGFKAWFGVEPPVTPAVHQRLAMALPH